MTEEMVAIAICQEMGWDYYQYKNQPKWFLDRVKDKLEIDSENLRRQMRKTKRR